MGLSDQPDSPVVCVLDDLTRDVRIEVQRDEALARWESAVNVAPLGYGGPYRSRERAWA
jgi:hypothetical protein